MSQYLSVTKDSQSQAILSLTEVTPWRCCTGGWQEESWRKCVYCGSLKYQALDRRGCLEGGRIHQLVFDRKMPLWAWCAQFPADKWLRDLDANLSSDTECPLGEQLFPLGSSSHFGKAIDSTSSVWHSWLLHNKIFCGAHRCLWTEPEQRPTTVSEYCHIWK